jgi:hypothetical protein
MPGIHFFDLPTELLLKIYSELLVHTIRIEFLDSARITDGLGLYPALLRVNKSVYNEARPLLYSENRFLLREYNPGRWCTNLERFVSTFRSQMKFIHHITINFPAGVVDSDHPGKARLLEGHVKALEVIRDTFSGITTIEFLLSEQSRFMEWDPEDPRYSPIEAEVLDLIDIHLKDIPSLKNLIVTTDSYCKERLGEDLVNKMQNFGWIVEITK